MAEKEEKKKRSGSIPAKKRTVTKSPGSEKQVKAAKKGTAAKSPGSENQVKAAKKKTAATSPDSEKQVKTAKKVTVEGQEAKQKTKAAAPERTAEQKPARAKTDKPVEKKEKEKAAVKPKKEKPQKAAAKKKYNPRLLVKYKDEIIPAMMKRFNYKNVFEVPKLEKIALNVGMGKALQNSKLLDAVADDLAVISGQKPIVTIAKRSVSNFKLRIGNPIGCKVTLRSNRMYEFLDRFITIAIPRMRDFRGLSDKSFDGFGNYSIGIKEQIIFPEIDYDKVESIHGLDITIVTTANADDEARMLLGQFGMPFVESTEVAAIA